VPHRTDPVIVLVHGFPGNAHDWVPLAERLARGHETRIPDLLGFGGWPGDPTPEALGFDRQAEHLATVIDELGDRPVVLVGHDVGVPISVLAAAARPRSVRALVLLSGNLVTDPPLAPPMRLVGVPGLGRGVEAALFSRPALRAMARFGRRSGPIPASNDASERRAIRAIFAPALRDMATTFATVEAAAAAVRAPVALLYGDRDPFFSIRLPRRFTRLFSEATLMELPGVGHFPQLECPDVVAAAIDEQLARLDDRAAA
jgi:pimeloyl-ACP methyl ester carboxylesterase